MLHRKYILRTPKQVAPILFVMIIMIALVTTIFVLISTNHRVTALKNQYVFTAYDYELRNLDEAQIESLEENHKIEHIGFSYQNEIIMTKNKQEAGVIHANSDEIIAVSKVISGRLPQEDNEIVAEEWALQNLGINPVIGEIYTFQTVKTSEDGEEIKSAVSYKLAGILEDMTYGKRSGIISVYSYLQQDYDAEQLVVHIKWEENLNEITEMRTLSSKLNIEDAQIRRNVWDQDKVDLLQEIILVGALLVFIATITFYGIFRTFFINRAIQYGTLKAIGYQNKQVKKLILYEVVELLLYSIPFGLLLGMLVTYLVSYLSNDSLLKIYFWGELERFLIVVPYLEITVGVICISLNVVLIALHFSRQLNKYKIMDLLSERFAEGTNSPKWDRRILKLNFRYTLSLKYLHQSFRTTLFLIISITLVITLTYAFGYQAEMKGMNNQIGRELNFFNGDYLITTNDDMDSSATIKRETLADIKEIESVYTIETQSAAFINVIDKDIGRNENYLAEKRNSIEEIYGIPVVSEYQEEEMYLTKLKGYNKNALTELNKYVVEGAFNPDNISKDEVIVVMPRMATRGKANGIVTYIKEGQPIMDYNIGDQIEVWVHSKIEELGDDYWNIQTNEHAYERQTKKIVAIVYYPYMVNVSPFENAYPVFITSDKEFSKIFPTVEYQSANVNVEEVSRTEEEAIEKRLIDLAIDNQQITARSMIDEKEELERIYIKELVNIYAIAGITMVLVLLNVANTLQYRVYTRRKELALYHALGIKKKMIFKMIRFESRLIGITGLVLAIMLTYPISIAQFEQLQLYLYGQEYKYNYILFGVVGISILGVIELLARKITKRIFKSSVIEILKAE